MDIRWSIRGETLEKAHAMFYICSNQNKGAYTMSYQPQFPGMFDPDNGAVPAHAEDSARDARAALPPTEKQMHYATSLSLKTGAPVPKRALTDRAALVPFYSYHISKVVHSSPKLGVNNVVKLLTFGNNYTDRKSTRLNSSHAR